jgi:Flp pilus assembly protein TadD
VLTRIPLYSHLPLDSQPKTSLDPASEQLNAGIELHRAGKLAEASQLYRQVLVGQPSNPFALHLLGLVLGQTGEPRRAVELISRAVSIRSDVPDFHSNLGEFLRSSGQVDQSIASFERALALQPDNAVVRNGFGVSLAHAGRFEAAIAEFRRAAQLAPNYPDPLGNLAAALTAADRLDEAIDAARDAIRLNPKLSGAYNNLGNALYAKGDYPEAIAVLRKVTEFEPNNPKVHTNLAMAQMLLGDYTAGLREYEWRLQVPEFIHVRNYSQPRWDGSDLSGKTIFLYPEQGIGDAIQFARFIPQVAARGGKIVLELKPELVRLFSGFPDVSEIIESGKAPPAFDVHSPLVSLACALGMTAATIPADVPYLKADENLVHAWSSRFDGGDDRVRVGLVWSGRPEHINDRLRSLKLADLAPLAAATNAAFYSLQKGDAAAQGANPPAALSLVDWTNDLQDFADTAALIENLDLVITVDTSVAHLAGALGKRVWILLPFAPDWRWMLDRKDSPWYPTATLFRQKARGEWGDVIRGVAGALQNEKRA